MTSMVPATAGAYLVRSTVPMKVVFLQSVEGTALVGEIKDVKNGFARNYLLPRGLAAPAIEPYLQRAQSRAKEEEKRQSELDRSATAIAERLDGQRISIAARVGEQGKLYGSVTSVHIGEEVARLIGDDEFDHRKVLLPEAIKEVGVHAVRLRLTRNVEASVEVEVFAEGEEPGAAEAEGSAVEDEAPAPVATPEAGDDAAAADVTEESEPIETDDAADDEPA
jgi:large subunit ribosomal protein L9